MNNLRTMAPKEDVLHGKQSFPLECYVNVNNSSFQSVYPSHWHDEAEIIYVERGPINIVIHSKQILLESDTFYLVPAKLVHSLISGPDSLQKYLVFKPSMVTFALYDKYLAAIIDSLQDVNTDVIPITPSTSAEFLETKKCFNFIFDNIKDKDEGIKLLIKAKLLELLARLSKQGIFSRIELGTSFEKQRSQKLKDLFIWVQEHHSGPLSIEDAAAKMNFSASYFCRFFKRATGLSFTSYVNNYRLEMAVNEIEKGEKPISEIAVNHGFENESYFFRLFKKKYGTTPLKYRLK
ncbi:MAG: AraC family transcriptional regulator [Succinivibrio sp.]